MIDGLQVLDTLEERLIERHYRRRAPRRRLWLPAASVVTAAIALVVVLLAVLPGGDVSPTSARAALDRAAQASLTAPTRTALAAGTLWRVRIITTFSEPNSFVLPQTGQKRAGRAVTVLTRVHELFTVTRGGFVTLSRKESVSFANPNDAHHYQLPTVANAPTETFDGRRRLSSPLATFYPLFTYAQLRALPSTTVGLRRAVSQVERTLQSPGPPVTRIHQLPKPVQPVHQAPVRSVGQVFKIKGGCCGSSPLATRDRETLNAIATLLTMPITPAVRAGLYHLAATLPGVRFDGTATDALGRSGAEISLGHGNAEMKMIFDEQTGALLATKVTNGTAFKQEGLPNETQTVQSLHVVSRNK